ncbi:MAG TPA: HD domain-containing protein [Candidatus Nanoarchaeia archaeon]|nr:HD domain-containing protein [Candidatus Nanoarchaeia archaeon]
MVEKLFLDICAKNSHLDLSKIKEALAFSKKNLVEKKRLSGESIFDHNLRVALILVKNKSDQEVLIASLLQGIDLNVRPDFISEGIIHLLSGIKELQEIKLKNKKLEGEVLRKLILTTLKDVRVVLIKLALKLDNLKSISIFPVEEQKRIAEEVLEVYAPLAYRLGADKIRVQLEDLAFQVLNPRKYREIVDYLEEGREEREKEVENSINLIKSILPADILLISIKGRSKNIYSIYKKIKFRGVGLTEQYDLLGIRIIVPEIKDCYALLGLLHEKFDPISGRLKDYIANPKLNFYRSIHTGVKLPNGKVWEIQIRTPEMDEFAEEGLAAHWKYKGIKSEHSFEKKISWLKEVLELQKSESDKDNLDNLKVDIFGDKIYCYTPKGDVKELSLDSTILDFAFAVHEDIGSKCVGARVNGKFVPLKQVLHSGDVIEILTNKNQRPRRSWIKLVQTSRARQKIRKSLKVNENLSAFHYRSWKPVLKEESGVLVNSEDFPKAVCILAKCCHALPGEKIVGIVTKRRMISVHKEDCRTAIKEQGRWVGVKWKDTFNQKIEFQVESLERSGLLADLLHTIASAGFEVKEAKAKLVNIGMALCTFLVVPRDLDQLKKMVERIIKVKGIRKIYFE